MDIALPRFSVAGGSRSKFGKRVVAWLAVVSLILIGISGLIFHSITQLVRSSDWVAHSYQVLDTLDLTEAFFTDAEASERGYVATCKPSMISPFRHDLPLIYGNLATLRTLVDDNPTQRERLSQLSLTMTAELERMSTIITTTTDGHQLQAEQMLTDQQNVSATLKIAAVLNAMEKDERGLLAGRLSDVRTSALRTLASSLVGVAAIFGILGFVFWLIRRETRRREKTETSLQENKRELEDSLQELHRYNASARSVSLLGELLQTCHSIDEAVAITSRHLLDLMPKCAGTIALFNNSRDSIEVVHPLGDKALLGDVLFSPLFQSGDCWGLRRGRAHLASPDGFEPRCAHVEGSALHFLCIPMTAQGETLGVVTMACATLFADVERQTLQTITEQLSLALANLKLQESLRNQSLRDPLTGLYNRRYMDEALPREIARASRQATPLAIAMVDIDHFKRFNDTHGHEGGDVLLAAFGRLLAEHARGGDIVCRYGGEEFAVILPETDGETAARRLDEIRIAVHGLTAQNRGQPLGPVSMSAGVAIYPSDGAVGVSVLAAADAALYEAKHAGRDRVILAGHQAVAATG